MYLNCKIDLKIATPRAPTLLMGERVAVGARGENPESPTGVIKWIVT